MSNDLLRDYAGAAKRLRQAETDLELALKRLSAARTAGAAGEITPYRLQANRAARECNLAWEEVERIRRAYWSRKAKQAEEALIEAAMPLLSAIEFAAKAARAPVSMPAWGVLSHLYHLPRPVFAGEKPLPEDPHQSACLDRAEDVLVF